MFVLRNCTFVEALTEGTELKAGDILNNYFKHACQFKRMIHSLTIHL